MRNKLVGLVVAYCCCVGWIASGQEANYNDNDDQQYVLDKIDLNRLINQQKSWSNVDYLGN